MEAVELCLSNGTAENADNCSIVLELTENDPLFDKKKKLLLDKGFGVKVQIYLKSSSSLDSISNTLERMLQIGRIIHLDEVELYFGEHDTQLGFYSTRNELEALNSMLLLVNNSLSGQTYKQVNVLQDLQEAVIDKIHKIGNKYKVEMKIDKTYIGDKEKILVQWGENNGVRTKLEIACVEGAGRGTIAMEDLKVGDVALEIPVSIIISEDIVYKCDLYNILQKIDGMSSETMLLLWSMKEKHNCDSKFKNYFDTLPKEFNTGLSFGVDAIMALEGTLLLEEIMQAKEHLRNQYDEFFPALCNDYPDIFPAEFYTWEQFLWACELWYSNSMKVMFADGKLRTCLIPIAGFLNHSLYPHIVHYGKVDSVTNSLKFPLSRPCSAGEQCCLSYGNFSTSHLITFYGFSPQGDNPYDVIPIDIDVGQDDCIEDCPMSNWSTHMVQGTWRSNNHNIFHYGLPTPLLDYLRRVRNPLQQEKDLSQANLEIELEVLETSTHVQCMMEILRKHELGCELAMESKDLQRKFLLILTSCSAGCKLVESVALLIVICCMILELLIFDPSNSKIMIMSHGA
ncbi:ribulose-1,5 bisphosphate carboxylase/oxygenase large subunit N-methyltransferase, chloroplastic [Pistacia vera]|uniref:ribulose-1,5 bisphosphate carboxylase/oxygenase large subunit N-methyltransferase, chloroplastic n=1 Tax=Pistacia vera TaxID=55513 RepID=UPI00126371AC|nr:ribulose-1,5 bisphosphate carboxylase/oxygenase large subunit N-methyltransferase, chloroplastic [Pistacia vera]